jgi:hypothetical protein
MKNTIVEDHEKYVKDSDRAKFLGLLVFNALKDIAYPDGMIEPSVEVSVYNPKLAFVRLYDWPLEASCCYVAEVEELLDAEATTETEHYYGDKAKVTYILKNEDITIHVLNSGASGCKLKYKDVPVRIITTEGKEFDGIEC